MWFYDLIHTWKMLAAVVGVTLIAHLLALYGELHWPQQPHAYDEYVEVSVLGSIRPEIAFISFGVGLIVYVAFLIFTRPRCKFGWAVGIAFVCASLEAATVAAVDGTQRGAWISFFYWESSFTFAFVAALSSLLPFNRARP